MSSAASRTETIIDALVPGVGIRRDVLLIVGAAALTAACAQVTIPWQPVPFTLQTLSVMLCGLTLGAKRGALSQLAYVAAGIAGAPVFAGGRFGIGVIVGPTGGYLLSYAFAAGLLGWCADRGWTKSFWKTAAAMAIGDAVILASGTIWLANYIGLQPAIEHGVLPFVIPEIGKAAVVIAALPLAWKTLERS